jgi:transcriptional regulator with XRE-family HTH domain
MPQLNYDLKLMEIIKGLRQQSQLKHVNLAKALNVDRTTYGRMECGESAITPGQLRIIAHHLKTNHFQILSLADAHFNEPMHSSTFSTILIKAILTVEGKGDTIEFTNSEFEFVIETLRKKYDEMQNKKAKIACVEK